MGAADESWRTKRGKAADQILWLSYSFSQLFKIAKQFTFTHPKALTFHEPRGLIVHGAAKKQFVCLMK